MFIEYQYPGDQVLHALDLASEITNLRNNGNNVIVGYIQPSKKIWYKHLHDWCQIFMKNPPVFLMISIEHQVNFHWGTYWEEFGFDAFIYDAFIYGSLASLGLLMNFDEDNCFKENERKFEENQRSCGCRLQVHSNCIPNIIYIPPQPQSQGLVDWIKRLVEPECLVFDDCRNHTHINGVWLP